MNESTLNPSNRPIGEEPSAAGSLLRHLLPLALVGCLVASFLFPDLPRRFLPGRLGDPAVAAMLSFFALFLFAAVSGIRDSRRRQSARRDAVAAFAASVGGRVTERPPRLGSSGWEDSGRVEYDAHGRPAVLSLYRGKQATFSFRLAAEVSLRREFQIQVVPNGAAMRFLLSKTFLLPVFQISVRTGGGESPRRADPFAPATAPEMTPALLAERLRYLADDPVLTGDTEFDRAFLVKATDRDAARVFASDPSVRAALVALAARTRNFQVSIESERPAGPGQLIVGVNAEPSAELFLAMDGVLRAAAAGLARAGVVGDGARGVA